MQRANYFKGQAPITGKFLWEQFKVCVKVFCVFAMVLVTIATFVLMIKP